MNRKRAIYSVAAVFVMACVYDFIIHRLAFTELYLQTASVWRDPAEMEPLAIYASQLLFSIIFVWIFSLNYENKGVREGVRYGMYIGALLASIELGTYTYLPIPFILTLSWMGAVFLKCVLCGIVNAVVYTHSN